MSDTESDEVYSAPPHGWTCFHCGETFTTPGAARNHFGETPQASPGCLMKVQVGDERGWLMQIRKLEEELAIARKTAVMAEHEAEIAFGEVAEFKAAAGVRSSHDLRMFIDSLQGRVVTANALIDAFRNTSPQMFAKVVG